MGVWCGLFALMIGTGFLGGRHPGARPEFWLQACAEGRRHACRTWVETLSVSCQHGSAHACYAAGLLLDEGRRVPRDLNQAAKDFGRGCDLELTDACRELVAGVAKNGPGVFLPACEGGGDGESCFLLASLYYAGRGVPQDYARAASLFRQSCDSGWARGCGGLAECYRAGLGVAASPRVAAEYFEKACRGDVAPSCYAVAVMYRDRSEHALARERFQQACDASIRLVETNAAYFQTGSASAPKFCTDLTP